MMTTTQALVQQAARPAVGILSAGVGIGTYPS